MLYFELSLRKSGFSCNAFEVSHTRLAEAVIVIVMLKETQIQILFKIHTQNKIYSPIIFSNHNIFIFILRNTDRMR